jgi:hypothetical protein
MRIKLLFQSADLFRFAMQQPVQALVHPHVRKAKSNRIVAYLNGNQYLAPYVVFGVFDSRTKVVKGNT